MLRRAANKTQEQVAAELGINRSTVAKWETGVAMPRTDKLRRLAAAYGCTVDDLMDEHETTNQREWR